MSTVYGVARSWIASTVVGGVDTHKHTHFPQVVGWFGLECFCTTPRLRSSAWKPLMVSRPVWPPAKRVVKTMPLNIGEHRGGNAVVGDGLPKRGRQIERRTPWSHLGLAQTDPVGFIGSGRIGGMEARLAIAAGYDVVLSNSRGPQALKDLVKELGPHARAATPAGAAAAGDLVVVSIPPRAYPAVPVKPLAGRSWTRSTTSRNATGGYQGSVARSPAARCSSGTWVWRTWSRCSARSPSGPRLAGPCGGRGRPSRPADRRGRPGREGGGDRVPRRDRVRHRGRRYARLWRPPFSSSVPARSSRRTTRSATSGVPCRHSGNTRRTRRLIATGDQRSGDCADMAAGQLPVVVSMPRYSLNTCSNREPSTRNTVVSGPTKTSAQTSAVAGVRAVLATALAADRHGRSG